MSLLIETLHMTPKVAIVAEKSLYNRRMFLFQEDLLASRMKQTEHCSLVLIGMV